ncbi:MAG: hypothetical protein JNK05_40360 [Myxococcales bacterium]|nr:hypothetical protein [Myxococcales bacterium]
MSASWNTVSRVSPPATNLVAACVDPRTERARLAITNDAPAPAEDPDRGRIELWQWVEDRWDRTHEGLFSTRDGAPFGGTLLLFSQRESGTLRVALGCDDGVLRVIDPDRPQEEKRYKHRSIPSFSTHAWAFEDSRAGHVWIVTSDGGSSSLFRWTEEALELVATGPYFVRCALDAESSTLFAQTVDDESYCFDPSKGAWKRDALPADKLDGLAWDPTRRAIIALRVVSEQRMDAVVRDSQGWKLATPALWAETYRNQMTLVVDHGTNALLAFGGQDFDKSGALSHETLFGREGAMRQTQDRSIPPSWGRYNSLLATEGGLLALDHGTLRVHKRVGEAWEPLGRMIIPDAGYIDDRGINATWGDGAIWVVDHEGRVAKWTAKTDETVVCVGPNDEPGTFYSHRVAMGFDDRAGELVLFMGDRARRTFRLRGAKWQAVETSSPPVAGIATGAGTPEGFYVLARNGLFLARDGAWVKVAPSTTPQSYVLRFEPKRRALVAATHEAVYVLADGAWRAATALPEGARLRTMGSGHAELGVDAIRDELILCDENNLWSLPLDSIDWSGCSLPTGAPTKKKSARAKKG